MIGWFWEEHNAHCTCGVLLILGTSFQGVGRHGGIMIYCVLCRMCKLCCTTNPIDGYL